MITVYSKNVNINSGSTVPLNTIKTDKGETAFVQNNSLNLLACGVYTIMGVMCVTSQTPGDITVQLYQDGNPLPETEVTVSIATAGAYEVLYFLTDITRSNGYDRNSMCSTGTTVSAVATHSVEGSEIEFKTAVLKEFRVIGR